MQMLMNSVLEGRDDYPMRQWQMSPYRNREAPVVFWGVDQNELKVIEEHKGEAIIVWRGRDLFLHGKLKLWDRDGWRHIAVSKFHEDLLTEFGIPYERFNLPGRDLADFTYVPAGDGVFFYSAGDNYGADVFEEVKARLPNERFAEIIRQGIMSSGSRQAVKRMMMGCWLGLRLRPVDGTATTVLEMASMGRHSVYNGDIPGSISYTDVDDIVAVIENADRRADALLPRRLTEWLTLDRSWL